MKITRVQTIAVNAETRHRVFVKVITDQQGLCAWGEDAAVRLHFARR